MRCVVQRSLKSNVIVNGNITGEIESGLVVLIGFKETDIEKDFDYIVKKILGLRIFEDENGKLNLSVKNQEKEILIVPNFTLYGDARKGYRPSFTESAGIENAREMFNKLIERLKNEYDENKIKTGVFREDMNVLINNDGPITIILDSEKVV